MTNLCFWIYKVIFLILILLTIRIGCWGYIGILQIQNCIDSVSLLFLVSKDILFVSSLSSRRYRPLSLKSYLNVLLEESNRRQKLCRFMRLALAVQRLAQLFGLCLKSVLQAFYIGNTLIVGSISLLSTASIAQSVPVLELAQPLHAPMYLINT